MKRIACAALTCAMLASLCGCSVFSAKSKDSEKKKEREVKVLGIPLVHTEEKTQ